MTERERRIIAAARAWREAEKRLAALHAARESLHERSPDFREICAATLDRDVALVALRALLDGQDP